jgi:hypothetical protein
LGDLELKGMRKDTRHKIYTGSGCEGGEPYVLFGVSSMTPCAWCWVVQMSSPKCSALLYIVQVKASRPLKCDLVINDNHSGLTCLSR